MIIVQIDVPIMGQQYDFQVDENTVLWEVQRDITEMICRKNQCELRGEQWDLLLWDVGKKRMLNRNSTMAENGIKTGSRLLFA